MAGADDGNHSSCEYFGEAHVITGPNNYNRYLFEDGT